VLPLGHLALAYLTYAVVAGARYIHDRRRLLPTRWALLPLAVGSQFPDLIDKPLAYYEILAYGRSFAHSILTFTSCCVIVWWLSRTLAARWDSDSWQDTLRARTPTAFAVGYATHLLGDAWNAIAAGRLHDIKFVLWPLYRLPGGAADNVAPWTRMLRYYQQMNTHPQGSLIVLAVVLFVLLRVGKRLYDRRNVQSQDHGR